MLVKIFFMEIRAGDNSPLSFVCGLEQIKRYRIKIHTNFKIQNGQSA